jgi:hypothetical protein
MADSQTGRYDFILGRDFLHQVGLDMLFSKKVLRWDDLEIPMKVRGHWSDLKVKVFKDYLMESQVIRDLAEESYTTKIMDSKYEKQDLVEVVRQQTHLSKPQRELLLHLLMSHEGIFQGTLGVWPDSKNDLELVPGAKPYCARPYRIPHIHLETLRKELDRLVDIGVLGYGGSSEWGAPMFIISKKDGRVGMIADLWCL